MIKRFFDICCWYSMASKKTFNDVPSTYSRYIRFTFGDRFLRSF